MIKSKLSIALLMATSLPIGMQANNIIESGDTSRVYDIDEVVVIDQPKEAFRLRQHIEATNQITIERSAAQWLLAQTESLLWLVI